MSCCNHLAAAVDHRFHGLEIFFPSQLIYSYNCRGHGTDQHLHAFRFGTAVQHIGAHAKVILGNALIGPCKLTSLVHNSHCHSREFFFPVAELADNVTKQSGFASPWRGNDQSVGHPVSFSDVRHHRVCTAYHLMGKAHIDAGNIFHSPDLISIQDYLSGNAYPVAALNSEKALADLILIRIQGVAAYVLHGFL